MYCNCLCVRNKIKQLIKKKKLCSFVVLMCFPSSPVRPSLYHFCYFPVGVKGKKMKYGWVRFQRFLPDIGQIIC